LWPNLCKFGLPKWHNFSKKELHNYSMHLFSITLENCVSLKSIVRSNENLGWVGVEKIKLPCYQIKKKIRVGENGGLNQSKHQNSTIQVTRFFWKLSHFNWHLFYKGFFFRYYDTTYSHVSNTAAFENYSSRLNFNIFNWWRNGFQMHIRERNFWISVDGTFGSWHM
jgi:hypothetical protein